MASIDPTGVAFNNNVFAWTGDQFSGLPTTEGSEFSISSDQGAQSLFLDARYTSPILYAEERDAEGNLILPKDPDPEKDISYEQITAKGTVTTDSGETLTFNEDGMSFTDAIWFEGADDGFAHWLIKGTGDEGQEVYFSDYGLRAGETYTVASPNPAIPAYIPNPSEGANPIIPTGSGASQIFRVDVLATPDSPLYRESGNTDDPGSRTIVAYDRDDTQIITGPDGGGGQPGATFKLIDGTVAGKFVSYDNDNYINDGNSNYESYANDTTQQGDYYLPDGTLAFAKQIYQAETGLVLQAPDGHLIKAAYISFGSTYSTQQLLFADDKLEVGIDYQVVQQDGTPGFSNPTDQLEVAFEYPICFGKGTQIKTQNGLKSVEELQAGDLIWTKDHGYQPARWIGHSEVSSPDLLLNEKLRPIRIRKNALGANLPEQDLIVSPQHRVVVKSTKALQIEGVDTVLIPAKDLLEIEGVDVVKTCEPLTYYHVLFDKHQIILANGIESESLFNGPEALRSVRKEAREELLSLFPELADEEGMFAPAASIVRGNRARKIVRHNLDNNLELQ